MLGKPSRNRIRAVNLSACSISSMDWAPLLASSLEPQLSRDAVVQPVLVDRCQLAARAAVEIFDDLVVALHDFPISPFLGDV